MRCCSRLGCTTLVLAALTMLSNVSGAQEPVPVQGGFFDRLFGRTKMKPAIVDVAPPALVEVPTGRKHLVIVMGLTGGDEFRDRLMQTTRTLVDVLTTRGGFDPQLAQVWLGEAAMAELPDWSDVGKGVATKESLRALADSLRESVKPEDTLWMIVISHTYFDGRRIWLNLSGDDIEERQFGEWFRPVGGRESVFWMTMPTSGFYIKPLSQPGRIVISATEADREVIATEFPHALARLLTDPPPEEERDPDGDGRLSLLDLYLMTARRTAESFVERDYVATEHARIDDNGDQRGTEVQRDYLPESLEGRLAEGVAATPRTGDLDGAYAATILLPPELFNVPVAEDDETEDDEAEAAESDGESEADSDES